MLDRRGFLKRLLPAAAGIVVAPTLAETLYHGAKKYFFLNGNPLQTPDLTYPLPSVFDYTNKLYTIATPEFPIFDGIVFTVVERHRVTKELVLSDGTRRMIEDRPRIESYA